MQAVHPMGIMINALEYARRLREAGVDRDSAEAQAEALTEVLNHAAEHRLATKDDLKASETSLREELRSTAHRLDSRIDQLEIRLTHKMLSMMITTVVLLGSLMTAFHFH